jgi:hypothetical protein
MKPEGLSQPELEAAAAQRQARVTTLPRPVGVVKRLPGSPTAGKNAEMSPLPYKLQFSGRRRAPNATYLELIMAFPNLQPIDALILVDVQN